jgi:hypothetical protein
MVGYQSFYQAQLTAGISDSDLTIPLDNVPTPSEGYLVIEPLVPAKREIIYYTSKSGSDVTVPSGSGNGRGYDGTTATSHLQGADVIMAPVGAMFEGLQSGRDIEPGAITRGIISGENIVGALSTQTGGANDTSYTDLPDSSVTFSVPTDCKILLFFSATMRVDSNATTLFLAPNVDGSISDDNAVVWLTNITSNAMSVSGASSVLANLSAGSHEIKLQRKKVGSGPCQMSRARWYGIIVKQ